MRGFAVVALLVAAGCNANGASVPSQPAYDVDVRPILMAHCVRCHGAGGKANTATEPTGPDAAVLPSIRLTAGALAGLHSFFDQFGPSGNCNSDGGVYPADCKLGASTLGPDFPAFVRHGLNPDVQMPPPPAPELDDWAIQTLTNWAKESPLICSRAANPDPGLFCP